jgi:plastocyanin
MKHLLLCLLLPASLAAQVTHNVQVGGSLAGGTPPFYAPQHLTINVGDNVVWTNTSGTHNVNGSTNLFPANPEGFTSGAPASGNWTFQRTFTIAGLYNYHCSQNGHSATQFGSITVLNPSTVEERTEQPEILLYPVPAADVLVVELGTQQVRLAEVVGVDGRLLHSEAVNGRNRLDISTTSLAAGQYFLRLTDERGHVMSRPFRRQ